MEDIKLDNSTLFSRFKTHIEADDNKNIIFSAPFGTGKTTFIKEFFLQHKQEYNCFHIYPVNYSVASNEDIFELIKYDILFKILIQFKDSLELINDLNFTKTLAIQLYISQNLKPLSLVQKLFSVTGKVGASVDQILTILKNEESSFDKFFKEINISEEQIITEYLELQESKEGSVLEFDSISRLIYGILERLKNDNGESHGKENVLIIDDLDRIDPEHIFRIFNILSAHNDWETNANKFGFDKIILVCDIDNIRDIYFHRYGKNVGFDGYINKFFSREIFRFNNQELIINSLSEILSKIESKEDVKSIYSLAWNNRSKFRETVIFLLKAFITARLLDLRALINTKEFRINAFNFFDRKNKGIYNNSKDFEILVLVDFFTQLFGDINLFKSKLDRLCEISIADPNHLGIEYSYHDKDWGNWILEYCVPIWHIEGKSNVPSTTYLVSISGYSIYYNIESPSRKVIYSIEKIIIDDIKGIEIDINKVNFIRVIKDSIEKLLIDGILK